MSDSLTFLIKYAWSEIGSQSEVDSRIHIDVLVSALLVQSHDLQLHTFPDDLDFA